MFFYKCAGLKTTTPLRRFIFSLKKNVLIQFTSGVHRPVSRRSQVNMPQPVIAQSSRYIIIMMYISQSYYQF